MKYDADKGNRRKWDFDAQELSTIYVKNPSSRGERAPTTDTPLVERGWHPNAEVSERAFAGGWLHDDRAVSGSCPSHFSGSNRTAQPDAVVRRIPRQYSCATPPNLFSPPRIRGAMGAFFSAPIVMNVGSEKHSILSGRILSRRKRSHRGASAVGDCASVGDCVPIRTAFTVFSAEVCDIRFSLSGGVSEGTAWRRARCRVGVASQPPAYRPTGLRRVCIFSCLLPSASLRMHFALGSGGRRSLQTSSSAQLNSA